MPEGDTVWRLAQRLGDALAGHPLTCCDLRVPRLATVDLTGREVLEVRSRGKHLLTRFEGGLTLHSPLRMDGAWKIYAPAERWRGGPAHQIRAVLGTAEHTAVGYRLPVLDLLRTADESRVVGHLGPDLLGPDWDPEQALGRLLSAPGRPLGEALLDQRNLAGIGNVYKSELCFLLRASPGSRSANCPGPSACPPSPKSSWRPTNTAPPAPPPPGATPTPSSTAGEPAPTAGCGSTAGPPPLPALRYRDPHRRPGPRRRGARHLLVPRLPARPARRPARGLSRTGSQHTN